MILAWSSLMNSSGNGLIQENRLNMHIYGYGRMTHTFLHILHRGLHYPLQPSMQKTLDFAQSDTHFSFFHQRSSKLSKKLKTQDLYIITSKLPRVSLGFSGYEKGFEKLGWGNIVSWSKIWKLKSLGCFLICRICFVSWLLVGFLFFDVVQGSNIQRGEDIGNLSTCVKSER